MLRFSTRMSDGKGHARRPLCSLRRWMVRHVFGSSNNVPSPTPPTGMGSRNVVIFERSLHSGSFGGSDRAGPSSRKGSPCECAVHSAQCNVVLPQQCLNFLPDPLGQGSLRPIFGIVRRKVTHGQERRRRGNREIRPALPHSEHGPLSRRTGDRSIRHADTVGVMGRRGHRAGPHHCLRSELLLAARRRPLCPYPQEARYVGPADGNLADASNYGCVARK
jgi:hypothetical protein